MSSHLRPFARRLLAGTIIAASGFSGSAWANAGDAAPAAAGASQNPAAAPAADSSTGLGEIVVTAQRKSENIQKVPISVSAFSGTDLKRLSIENPKALQFSTPGLTFPEDNGTLNPYIRGRGTGFSGAGLEGSIAYYADDIYQESQQGTGALFDVSQVQVLKGPQGTLYGRNATGGAIVVKTNDPTHDFSGYLEGGYGSLNERRFKGVVNLPLSDTLALRIAGYIDDRGNFLTNIVDGSRRGQASHEQVRGKLLWNINPDFTAVLSVSYQKSQTDYLRKQIVDGTGTAVTYPSFYNTQQSLRPSNLLGGETRLHSVSSDLHLNYVLDQVTLTSITGYHNTFDTACADNDNVYPNYDSFCTNTPANASTAKIKGAYDHDYSQELRAVTNFTGFFNLAVGANYQHTDANFPAVLEGLLFGPLTPVFNNFVKLNSYSAYGEANFRLAEGLKLTAGGRYTKDSRKLTVFNNADVGLAFGIPAAFLPATFTQSVSFSTFTPRAVLDYDVGNANYYLSYNKGFKSGGFNVPAIFPQTALKPEKIDGFEAGAKFKMLDNRLRLDLAYFHTKSTNVQVASIDTATNTVVQQNAAGVKADGFEANMNIAASDCLTLQIGAAYLHSRFTDFPSASVYAVDATTGLLASSSENLKGFPTTNSPDFTANANATYRFDLPKQWSADVTVQGRYTTAYDFQAGAGGPLRADRQNAFGIVDLTGDIFTPGKRITISWYVDNVFQTHYYDIIQTGANIGTAAIDNGRAGGTYAGPGLPRTYGGSIRYTF